MVSYVAPPVARLFHVPLSIEHCAIFPLTGYVNIKGVRIENPSSFCEKNPDVYAKTPLLALDHFKVRFAMSSLFKDTYVVDEVSLNGLQVFYSYDFDTTNVDQLLKDISGEKNATESIAEEVAEKSTSEEKKDLRLLFSYIHAENNSVTIRRKIPLTIPLPPVSFTNIDTYSLREKVELILKPVKKMVSVTGSGIGVVGDGVGLIGDGVGAASDIVTGGLDLATGLFSKKKKSSDK